MADTANVLTPKVLAAELGIDPKRLRGWLRQSDFARTAEQKNTSWTISNEAASAAREHFAPKPETNEK